jgi:hypothetical protein
MEIKNYTIINKVFVCKTNYIVHAVVDMIIPKLDNC